jgi:hypothetical protein
MQAILVQHDLKALHVRGDHVGLSVVLGELAQRQVDLVLKIFSRE